MSRNIHGMCFDCSWFGNICDGGARACHNFESKFDKKGSEPMELYKKNLKLMAEFWNGKTGEYSNIEYSEGAIVSLSCEDDLLCLTRNPMRLTASYVESLNEGYEAVEWNADWRKQDTGSSDLRHNHGWLLKKKAEKGCSSCCRYIRGYESALMLESGTRWGVGCKRPINESCGAPDYPCWIPKE